MAVDSEALLDWLACCYAEKHAPNFLAGGCNNVENVRKLTEEEFNKLGVPTYIYDMVRKLHDRTRTREELSRELLNMSLYAACQRGQLDRIDMLLANSGVDKNWRNPYDTYERTPLIIASEEGHRAVVELLISRGAHVNDTNKNGWTALHMCALSGHVETSQCLIKHNANVNAVNKTYRQTPAHFAAEEGHLDVLKVLHQHGADLSLRDKFGDAPLELSQRNNHTAVTLYLESVGKSKPTPLVGTQNRNLVKKHIEQQGSLPVRSLKSFFIGPSRVGKTTARRRLTGEITNISRDEIVPSTGIEAPLTVQLYHPTEQSSVLLSAGWHCQGLEEQCRSLCSRVLSTPADPPTPSSSSSAHATLQPRPAASPSTITTSPSTVTTSHAATSHTSQSALSKLSNIVKRGWRNLTRSSRDEVTTALTSLVKANDWLSIREFLTDIRTLTLLQIIDIGGQPEFHEVIPLLLHGLALNMIFLNVTQDLDSPYTVVYRDDKGSGSIQYKSEFTIREIIQRALCTISSLQTTVYHKPAAILIGTHVDCSSEAAVLSLDRSIQESFKDADFLKNDVLCTVNKEDEEETRYIHPLDNVSEDSTDIEELRELITRIVYQRFPTEEVPTSALLLQLILRMKFDPHPGWCSVEDCVKIAECCGISREDLLKDNGILDYLHDRFGTILFYRKVVGLCDRVIVNANIIMGPPSELFVQAFGAKKGEPKTAERIRATGEISQRLMNNACKPGNGDTHVKKKKVHKADDKIPTDEIIALLESRCVIYKEARSANDDPVYFMPAVLYPDHSVAKESSDPVLLASLHIPPILFVPSTEYVPLGQFSATAVELSKEWKLDKKAKRYRNRIKFFAKCKGGRLLHVEFLTLSTHLELRVVPHASPQPIDPRLMIESRHMVWKSIAKVASLYPHTQGVRWNLGFHCPQALQLGQRPHCATCESEDNPQEMICQYEECCHEGLIALDNKHKCWFTVVTNTPSTQGVSSMATPTEQVPVKQDNHSSLPHSGDSELTTPSTQDPLKQALPHYDQSAGDCGVTTPSTQEPAKQPVPHQSGDSDRVSLFQFMETVASKIPDKWYIVGVALGLSTSQLNAIREHHLANPLICFSDVYEHWQQMSTPQQPSNWSSLVTALNSDLVAEKVLAHFIQDNFM